MTASSNLDAAASAAAEDLASDVTSVLSSKDLDTVPGIKAARQRIQSKIAVARELTAEKSRIAAKKAREAAVHANAYAHDEPWQVAGAALAAGLVVGFLIGRR